MQNLAEDLSKILNEDGLEHIVEKISNYPTTPKRKGEGKTGWRNA